MDFTNRKELEKKLMEEESVSTVSCATEESDDGLESEVYERYKRK